MFIVLNIFFALESDILVFFRLGEGFFIHLMFSGRFGIVLAYPWPATKDNIVLESTVLFQFFQESQCRFWFFPFFILASEIWSPSPPTYFLFPNLWSKSSKFMLYLETRFLSFPMF